MNRATFFCQVGLILLAKRGVAQQCYRCSSCGDEPFSTAGAATVNCSSNLCYTTTGTYTLLGVMYTAVSRGCAVNGTAVGCVTGGSSVSILATGSGSTCTCSGDKCNSAASGALSQQCYYCADCGDDPFTTSDAVTGFCSSNLCYKSKTTATFMGVTVTTVSRGCATTGTSVGCVSGGAGIGSLVSESGTTCTCSGTKCNMGATRTVSVAAIVLSLSAALVLC